MWLELNCCLFSLSFLPEQCHSLPTMIGCRWMLQDFSFFVKFLFCFDDGFEAEYLISQMGKYFWFSYFSKFFLFRMLNVTNHSPKYTFLFNKQIKDWFWSRLMSARVFGYIRDAKVISRICTSFHSIVLNTSVWTRDWKILLKYKNET